MPRRFLVQRGDESFDLVEAPAPNEHHLQEIMKNRPQLIPSDDLGLDGDLLVIGRETSLASGLIDLLCLSRSGDVVLIEFKTGPQNPDFRHALAQLIDYGSDLWRLSVDDFDSGVVQRYLRGSNAAAEFVGVANLDTAIARTNWNLSADELAALHDRLADVLANGDFFYVVAAQRFTSTMLKSLEYMNSTMRFGRFFLVEIVQLEGADLTAHAAQVVGAPPKRTGTSGGTPGDRANEATYLAAIGDSTYGSALKDLFATCGALGLTVYWGSKGFSIQIQTPDRNQPLSVGWGLPDGSHWMGARYLTLGIDPASLAQTPSVVEAVDRYLQTLSVIAGGKRVSTKLNAYTFEPSAVATAMSEIASALSQLVTDSQTTET
jgi:hypothetical protein